MKRNPKRTPDTLTQFDRPTCTTLGREIMDALQPIATKYGLKIREGNGTFDPMRWTKKFEFSVTETAEGVTFEQAEFNRFCGMFNLKPADYKRTFILANGPGGLPMPFQLVGLKPSRPLYPVIGLCANGKRYKLPATVLTRPVLNGKGKGNWASPYVYYLDGPPSADDALAHVDCTANVENIAVADDGEGELMNKSEYGWPGN